MGCPVVPVVEATSKQLVCIKFVTLFHCAAVDGCVVTIYCAIDYGATVGWRWCKDKDRITRS